MTYILDLKWIANLKTTTNEDIFLIPSGNFLEFCCLAILGGYLAAFGAFLFKRHEEKAGKALGYVDGFFMKLFSKLYQILIRQYN